MAKIKTKKPNLTGTYQSTESEGMRNFGWKLVKINTPYMF